MPRLLRRSDSRTRAVIAGEASAEAAVRYARDVPEDPGAAAFFDVDNTMMIGSSIYHFVRGLATRQFFTTQDVWRFAYQQVVFRVGGKERMAHMSSVKEAALAFCTGHEVDELMLLGEEIYDELMADRIWSGTRSLAQRHLDAGQPVWLVTATPVELATIIARRLGLTGALGTVAEIVDGTYTGRLVGEPLHGPAKAEAILALAEREGLDLSRCSAYGDSANDIPMLSVVGHPCAINPDPELRRVARERGWEVRDFRTGRKVVKIGVPGAAATGLVVGVALSAAARHKRRADA